MPAPVFDAASGTNTDTPTPINLNHTCGADADFLVAIFACRDWEGDVSGTPTFNSADLTQLMDTHDGLAEPIHEVWYLANPDVGSEYQLAAEMDTDHPTSLIVLSTSGTRTIKDSSKVSDHGTNESSAGTIPIATSGGNLVVGALAARDIDLGSKIDLDELTSRETEFNSGSPDIEAAAGTVAAPGGTFNWTPDFSGTTVDSWDAVIFELVGFAAAGGATWIFSEMQRFYDELKRGLIPPDMLQKRYREVFI